MPIPVIPITNHYNTLHNLQNDLELPGELQNHHIKNCHIKNNVLSKQNNLSKKKDEENFIDWC